jgi:SPP1 gp7 family putative phage head morphogenesis protein
MGSEWFEQLAELAIRLSIVAEQTVARILGLEARRHTTNFMASAKRALGVDLSAVVRQEDLADALRDAAVKNARLIKGLADDVTRQVSVTVMNAVINGTPAPELRKQLTKGFGLSDRRAKLIARNEIASFNSDMNRIRHEQAGVTEYRWLTSHDERVRPLHRSLDGKVYEYGKPTGAEEGLPPGKPIACRCIAQAIVEF